MMVHKPPNDPCMRNTFGRAADEVYKDEGFGLVLFYTTHPVSNKGRLTSTYNTRTYNHILII